MSSVSYQFAEKLAPSHFLSWRVVVDKGVGSAGVASLAYAGTAGRNLLGNQAYVEPDTGVLTRFMMLT